MISSSNSTKGPSRVGPFFFPFFVDFDVDGASFDHDVGESRLEVANVGDIGGAESVFGCSISQWHRL